MSEKRVAGAPPIDPGEIKLRPQKRLFIILSIIMALWIVALVTMYFTTVWPQRHAPAPLPRENESITNTVQRGTS